MYVIIGFVLLLALLCYLIFSKPLILSVLLDTTKNDMHLNAFWMYPFLFIKTVMVDMKPEATVFIFKKRIFSKSIKKQKGKSSQLLQALKLKDKSVKVFYGLNSPVTTSILCGITELLAQMFEIDEFEQYPEFFSIEEYVVAEAKAELNIGKTIIELIRLKTHKYKSTRRNKYGSVTFDH